MLSDRPMSRRRVLAACCAAMATINYAISAPSMCVTSMAAELVMDETWKGFFLSSPFWAFPLAILIAGPLADRIGCRAVLLAGALLQSAGLLIISQADGRWLTVVGGLVVGAGTGSVDAVLTPIVCALYPEQRARKTTLLHAFYAIGLVGTVLAMLAMLGGGAGWRTVFLVLGIAPLPVAAGIFFVPMPAQIHAEGEARLRARQVVLAPAFLGLMLAIFLGGLTEIGPSSWLPDYVRQTTSGGLWAGGLGLLLFGVAMTVSRLSGSALATRLGAGRLFTMGSVICAGSLLLAALPVGTLWTVACLTLLGLGVAIYWPMIMSVAGDRYPQGGASMYSLLAMAGNLGGIVGPLMIGLVSERAGPRLAMLAVAAGPIVILFLMLRLAPKK